MKIIKRINTSAVLCSDNNGRQLVAFGKGIGFHEVGESINLSDIQRTFYNVGKRYLPLIEELEDDVLELSARLVDIATGLLSYELSCNLPFILADHISYSIERTKENIKIQLPLSYDIARHYPVEYKIGQYAVEEINKQFNIQLAIDEAAGIALTFINNAATLSHQNEEYGKFDKVLNLSVAQIEHETNMIIDRESFDFARYATHLQYLYDRVQTGQTIESSNADLYETMRKQYPIAARSADAVANIFREKLKITLSDEEMLYLMMHINRITSRKHMNSV